MESQYCHWRCHFFSVMQKKHFMYLLLNIHVYKATGTIRTSALICTVDVTACHLKKKKKKCKSEKKQQQKIKIVTLPGSSGMVCLSWKYCTWSTYHSRVCSNMTVVSATILQFSIAYVYIQGISFGPNTACLYYEMETETESESWTQVIVWVAV